MSDYLSLPSCLFLLKNKKPIVLPLFYYEFSGQREKNQKLFSRKVETLEIELRLASTMDLFKGSDIETRSSRTIFAVGKLMLVNKAGFVCSLILLPLIILSISVLRKKIKVSVSRNYRIVILAPVLNRQEPSFQ